MTAYYSNLSDKQQLLLDCEGIKTIDSKPTSYGRKTPLFVVVGDVKVPEDRYISVTSTATKGTIGKLVGIDFTTRKTNDSAYNAVECIDLYSVTYIIEVDGRKKQSRISSNYSIVLNDYTGPTQWVRNVTDRKHEVIDNPVNKFKQTLHKDDWIIGVGHGYGANKPLMIGKVTRWTKANVWAVTIDGSEFKLNDIKQTFLLPSGDHYIDELTMAIVKGWNGR